MKNITVFNIEYGQLEINAAALKLKYNTLKYAFQVFKFLASIAFIVHFIEKIETYKELPNIYAHLKFWIFAIASLYLVYSGIRALFKNSWSNSIQLNDLTKLSIEEDEDENYEDEDSKVEIVLIKSNGREKVIALKTENMQLTTFLEEIKKRNTRIIIEYI